MSVAADTDTVCRVCLADNINLNSIRNDLQNVYERITGEKYNKVSYPVHMCYICLTVLQKCHRFMETARDTNNVLKQWYKQHNEMRVARPLYKYSISKLDVMCLNNEDIPIKHEIKMEEEDLGVKEVQLQREFNTDVDIQKIDTEEQTDYIEVLIQSPNDTDDIEGKNDEQTDPIFCNNMDIEDEEGSLASNLDDEDTRVNLSSHDDDPPPMKKPKTIETKSQHQAPETSGETITKNMLLKHPRVHDENRKHVCDVCECRFYSLTSLNRHKAAMHKIFTTKEYICNSCSYTTWLKNNFEAHLRTHTDDKPGCRTMSPDAKDTASIKKLKIKEDNPTHRAPDTWGENAANNVLQKHARVHDENRPYVCDVCECRFFSLKSLKGHKVAMHKIYTVEEYFCDICNYTTMIKNNLQCHLRTHTGEKPFSCDICDYKCSVKGTLTRHIRTHTGDKPYSCDICDFKFTQKYHLKAHVRTHTGEKPFACVICDRKFTQTSTLKKHMRHHTGEKPYSCEICDHKFKRKDHLETHMRTHTGEKPFLCNICAFKCTAKYYLKAHMKTHTGDKPAKARRGSPRPGAGTVAPSPE